MSDTNRTQHDKPVILSHSEKAQLMSAVQEAVHSLNFLADQACHATLTESDVHTHLSLMRHYFNDLNCVLAGGQFLNKKLETALADLRTANIKIRELEVEHGSQVTAATGTAWIRCMSTAIKAWYKRVGFAYASETITPYGIILKFSEELLPEPNLEPAKNLTEEKIYQKASYQLCEAMGFDVDFDFSNAQYKLLDTDINRTKLKELFSEVFPNSQIHSFTSHCDRTQYLLRFEVSVPYQDIQNWLNNVLN